MELPNSSCLQGSCSTSAEYLKALQEEVVGHDNAFLRAP